MKSDHERGWVSLLPIIVTVTSSIAMTAPAQLPAYHDLSSMPTWQLGNMQVKGALGRSGSLAIAEMPAGKRGQAGNPHHHTQEQIVFGLKGSPMLGLSGRVYRLGSYGAVWAPPDAEHVSTNGMLDATSTFIEFQPVVRSDWFPPHPAITWPANPAPVAVPRDTKVFEDFDSASDGWTTQTDGVQSKMLNGKTIRLTVWALSSSNASATLNPPGAGAEQFVYVLEGAAQMAVDSTERVIAAQTLTVLSHPANAARLRSIANGRTVVAVFETR